MGLPLSIVSLQLTSTVTSSSLVDLCPKTIVLEGSITVLSQPVQTLSNYVEIGTSSSKREIYMYRETIVDDRCYECAKSSLKAVYKYFTTVPLCEFCGKNYKWGSFTFLSIEHDSKIRVSCV